jgi:hypothetical protein
MFTSIFGLGPGSGSETLELRIRIRQKFRILADPDPQHCLKLIPAAPLNHRGTPADNERSVKYLNRMKNLLLNFDAGLKNARRQKNLKVKKLSLENFPVVK